EIEDVDVLDKTPLIDIKPYVPRFDVREVTSSGWLENSQNDAKNKRSDDRFSNK
ncbi:MAG TPA: tRNA (N6-threonylcarbamoyladenosine(37)-N6)-methyltransferase TrmO, partial [Desulfobacteraceae bacterium]|nr:tRNA (N6-threonylcarbamoyladenosine(37)-N6)-methyltransferase TrmO [Desulfobacteraceae bacterium]